MPRSNVFIYIFTAIEIGFTQVTTAGGVSSLLDDTGVASIFLGGVWRVSHLLSTKTAKFL